jgi:simple sugar transport system ATP-binding protein
MTAMRMHAFARRRRKHTKRTDPAVPPVVRLISISKSFGAVKANQDISLDIRPGRIKALLGENGAGKSTLMSMLSGRFPPDSGTIEIDGAPARFRSPADGIAAGIGMVYQHFMLVERMTVAQNVLLGQTGSFWLSPRAMRATVGALAEEYGLAIDPGARVDSLSMGQRQLVEILKLLYRQSRVLIFDEPTAVLTPAETGNLFQALWNMSEQGKAIVFISHKLPEVIAVADEIAILRQGRIVDEFLEHEVPSEHALANRMVGREVILEVDAQPVPLGAEVLRLEGLSGNGLEDVSLSLRQGEILALAGVAGNGQKPLVETVAGLRSPQRGAVTILGSDWKAFYGAPQKESWRGGLAYIPEDRQGLATCPDLDMVDNFLLTTRHGFSRQGFLERNRAEEQTARLVEEHDVRPPVPATLARQLSGGNLQKLVIAREFYRHPRIIVAEQPTQGLDVSATEEVWRRLLQARAHAGVLLVTGDLNEALQLADRIAVMYRGRIMDVIGRNEPDAVGRIGLLMAGLRKGKREDGTAGEGARARQGEDGQGAESAPGGAAR